MIDKVLRQQSADGSYGHGSSGAASAATAALQGRALAPGSAPGEGCSPGPNDSCCSTMDGTVDICAARPGPGARDKSVPVSPSKPSPPSACCDGGRERSSCCPAPSDAGSQSSSGTGTSAAAPESAAGYSGPYRRVQQAPALPPLTTRALAPAGGDGPFGVHPRSQQHSLQQRQPQQQAIPLHGQHGAWHAFSYPQAAGCESYEAGVHSSHAPAGAGAPQPHAHSYYAVLGDGMGSRASGGAEGQAYYPGPAAPAPAYGQGDDYYATVGRQGYNCAPCYDHHAPQPSSGADVQRRPQPPVQAPAWPAYPSANGAGAVAAFHPLLPPSSATLPPLASGGPEARAGEGPAFAFLTSEEDEAMLEAELQELLADDIIGLPPLV